MTKGELLQGIYPRLGEIDTAIPQYIADELTKLGLNLGHYVFNYNSENGEKNNFGKLENLAETIFSKCTNSHLKEYIFKHVIFRLCKLDKNCDFKNSELRIFNDSLKTLTKTLDEYLEA